MEKTAMTANELIGEMFNTPKDLRHRAEAWFGELFVPTEVTETGEHSVTVILSPPGTGRIVVHAERERHWYPYRITGVETSDEPHRSPARRRASWVAGARGMPRVPS